jgi:myo-inositol 2-dehydrogenase / D-chiro-inositol 1-dehydrogenase
MTKAPRIAISGCGAVADSYYGPVLRAREQQGRLSVIGVHDLSPSRMAAVASRYFPRARCFEDFRQMAGSADLVIVASPAANHAAQSVAAIEAGAAVLCEKPLTVSVNEAEHMLAVAERSGCLLAVGMVRRQFAASRIVGHFIHGRFFGEPISVAVFEGGPFRWPVADPSHFTAAVAGGGVIADVGVHVVDLLQHWFGELELVSARDDAMGGVEANSALELRRGALPISVRLSRDWARPNRITVRLERATMIWENEEPGRAIAILADGGVLHMTEPNNAADFFDAFGRQIDNVLDRLGGGVAPIATVAEAISTIRLIEQAYARREPMKMPWLEVARVGG